MRKETIVKKGFLLMIPLMVTIFTVMMKQAAGPYWLGVNSDPAYLYLINALYLLDHKVPFFTDHPGITLELLGALVIKILTGGNGIVDKVLSDPERYLNAIHRMIFISYMASFLIMSFYALRKTKNVLFVLFLQTSALFLLTLKSYMSGDYVLPVMVNVNSDAFLPMVVNFYMMLVLKLFYDHRSADDARTAVLFGMVCGAGVTTKLTFLPLLLLPMILLRGWKCRGIFVGAFFLTAGLILSPVSSRYAEILDWIKQISVERSSIGKYLADLKGLLMAHWPLTILMGVGGLVVIDQWMAFRKTPPAPAVRQHTVFLSVLILVLTIQFMLVARHAGPHYMSPAYSIFGLILGWMYGGITTKTKNHQPLAGLVIAVLTIGGASYALAYHQHLRQTNQAIYHFSQKIFNEYAKDCTVFSFYRSSSLPMAIRFAEGHGNFRYYTEILMEKYPGALFYNSWQRVFHNFDKNVFLERAAPDGCALLYGSVEDFAGSDFLTVEKVEQVHNEKLFRIISTTLDQAHQTYLMARILEKHERYKEAYLLAIQAHRLGRPRTDEYAERLKKRIGF